ncbi:MAG: hypothetical protein JRI26_12320, partial [Deltaproteobacteria bacterium]|nr:hypothetical protein [Deltaproteobacteria bacterium]
MAYIPYITAWGRVIRQDEEPTDKYSVTWGQVKTYYETTINTFTSSLYIDALLKKTDVAVTNYIDALLLSSFPINVSIDAILEAVSSKTITTDIDALLKSISLVKTTDVDALLQSVGLEREVYIDAILKLFGVEKTSHIDALIKKEGVEGITSVDALLSVLNIEKSSY